MDNDEIHQAYRKLVKDKEALETEIFFLKGEVDRLIKYAPVSSVTHSRSTSNVSSVNMEEDFGYASAKNTLDKKEHGAILGSTPPASFMPDKDRMQTSDLNHTPDSFTFSKSLVHNVKSDLWTAA